MEHRSFEVYGSIHDLRTFFNESDEKSFLLMTNGSMIFKFPVSIEDKSGKELVRNDYENDLYINTIENAYAATSSFK